MPKVQRYVFVLWGQHCDEAAASIFVTELRKAGLLVRVVGVSGQRTAGAHGLTLAPDVMLSEALPLARRAIGVIMPCDTAVLRRFANDPSLGAFLRQAQANQARLVAGAIIDTATLLALGLLTTGEDTVEIDLYPDDEALILFAHDVAQTLIGDKRI
jgi:hypothetical protein